MRLSFNAPVPAKLLAGIRLTSDKETYKPTPDKDEDASGEGDHVRDSVTFNAIFPERTSFTLELPKGF